MLPSSSSHQSPTHPSSLFFAAAQTCIAADFDFFPVRTEGDFPGIGATGIFTPMALSLYASSHQSPTQPSSSTNDSSQKSSTHPTVKDSSHQSPTHDLCGDGD